MRRLKRIGLVILALAVIALAWEPTRVGVQTAILLPNLLDSGPKVLSVFSEAPQRSSLPYRAAVEPGADSDLAELWLPSWASAERPAGAMLLVFGVNNLGRNHPSIERVADGLARTGVAVLVPDSRTLLEGRLEVGEIDGVVRAFQLLAARPEVDRSRIGIVGFSVGGSLALLAARDPRIAEQVRWVNAFGAFGDAQTLPGQRGRACVPRPRRRRRCRGRRVRSHARSSCASSWTRWTRNSDRAAIDAALGAGRSWRGSVPRRMRACATTSIPMRDVPSTSS